MKRKIYRQLLDWKEQRNGEVPLLIEGVRCIRFGAGFKPCVSTLPRSRSKALYLPM